MTIDTAYVAGRMVLGSNSDVTRQAARRRDALNAAGLALPSLALEVGAFDNPTVVAADGFEVRYADYFSADELRATHRNNPRRRLASVVDVDYVIKGPRLSPFVLDTFDLVVANHVIEHIPDPIGWLCDIASFCSSRAAIFLTVPDMRFTFDIHKQESDITSLVRAHDEGKTRPNAYDLARMRYLHRKVDAPALWAGEPPPRRDAPRPKNYRQILERARDEARSDYIDVHCHFYTSTSFVEIFGELARSAYLPWEARLLQDVARGDNEFFVVLKRND